ncbi:pMGF100-4L [Recombinant African swine fever virus]|nr:pMGF100-4L [Recombinant African swine fever virus]
MHLRINVCYDLYYINGEYYEKIDDFIRLYPHIFYRPLYRYKS